MKASIGVLLFLTAVLSGCAITPPANVALEPRYQAAKIAKLSAVGYGAAPYDWLNGSSTNSGIKERYTEGQLRLMAMRASKLDAYRAMAEQVYGVRLTGGSTVSAMMAKNDNFRVSVDACVRGARVSNIAQMTDGSYETTIEMEFDESALGTCAPRASVHSATTSIYNDPTDLNRGPIGSTPLYGRSYYYAE